MALDHCSCREGALTLDWLDVEMGDMLSSVSGVVDRPSYDDAPDIVPEWFPLLATHQISAAGLVHAGRKEGGLTA